MQQKYRGVIYRRERDRRSDASGEAENGNSGSFLNVVKVVKI
jgi:hypothetical protein